LKVGDEVETVILSIDRDEHKMSLGLKQLSPDPWGQILEKYPVGSKHKAKVRNFTNFGVFVELEEGVDGLIHISDLSWNKKIKHPAEFTKIGEELDVVVLEVDVENRRLSLGHKQLEDNPWDTYESVLGVGNLQEGVIGKVTDKGAAVLFNSFGVEAFAPYRQLQKEDGTIAKEGETLEFKVIEFSKENRRVVVSHLRVYDDKAPIGKTTEGGEAADKAAPQQSTTQKAVKKIKESQEKSTLGDIDALAALKMSMEASEKKTDEN
jgi:small subunit ribosomal protein S1